MDGRFRYYRTYIASAAVPAELDVLCRDFNHRIFANNTLPRTANALLTIAHSFGVALADYYMLGSFEDLERPGQLRQRYAAEHDTTNLPRADWMEPVMCMLYDIHHEAAEHYQNYHPAQRGLLNEVRNGFYEALRGNLMQQRENGVPKHHTLSKEDAAIMEMAAYAMQLDLEASPCHG